MARDCSVRRSALSPPAERGEGLERQELGGGGRDGAGGGRVGRGSGVGAGHGRRRGGRVRLSRDRGGLRGLRGDDGGVGGDGVGHDGVGRLGFLLLAGNDGNEGNGAQDGHKLLHWFLLL